MNKRTPLYDMHVSLGAKMVDFGGWDMPINYGSQIEEHHQVRNDAGMFDVSHMTIVDFSGEEVKAFLQYLLANNVDRLKEPGKALYSCMLNESGGVIDDLIVYYLNDTFYRMVINAATTENDVAWMEKQISGFKAELKVRDEFAMIAVQGPNAREKANKALAERASELHDLGVFFVRDFGDLAIARTGYTGEDGYEIMVPAQQASSLWSALLEAGVKPCGLGARDTLRLEAGMNLYGTDMDESQNPLESGLSWTIAWEPVERDFVGRAALEKVKAQGATKKLVGLVLQDKGVLRNHQKVVIESGAEGEITSGSFSPTLGKSIALARVPVETGETCKVEIRKNLLDATVVKIPFARNGKSCL